MSCQPDLYDIDAYKNDLIVHHNFSRQYVNKASTSNEDLAFNVQVTNRCLKSWDDFRSNTLSTVSLVGLLNTFLQAKNIPVKVVESTKLETRLNNLSAKVRGGYRNKSGRKYQRYANT